MSADADPASDAPARDLPKPRPKGEPSNVVALRDVIEKTLVAELGGYAVDEGGAYVLGMESARVFVVPAWLDGDRSVCRVFAITNLDVPVTAELTSYLLAKNLDFVFGGFALDVEKGAVWFNHNLLGEFTQSEELVATIGAVATTADALDDEIKSRFGGRLFVDAPEETVAPPSMPGYL